MHDLLYSHWAYATILLFSLAGLLLIDRHLKLVVFLAQEKLRWRSPRVQALISTLGVLVGAFLVWDIAGILLGIFRTNPSYTLGLNLFTPNLPIEEVLFLALLVYVTLLTYQGVQRYINARMQS